MAALPEDMSVAIDELETAVAEMESRLETARAERDDAKARQIELEIENATLRRELTLARERQSAGADILRTIASAPGNAAEVLQHIAEATAGLFGCSSVSIRLAENGEWTDTYRFGESANQVRAAVPLESSPIGGPNLPGAVVAENRQINIPDLDNIDPAFAHWPGPPHARATGTCTMCGTPLRREGEAIGVLIVYRDRPVPFTEEELALLQGFANQAVIAIENTRLFNETREALERQTATAEILKVIASSPSDVQPVFEAIVGSAAQLFQPCSATITTLKDDKLHWNATAASISGFDVERTRTVYPIPFDPERSPSSRATLERRIIAFPDVEAPDTPQLTRDAAAAGGFRSITFVPLIDQEQGIGTIIFTHPQAGFSFSERQLALIQTFADQAVIAIQNARLFNETREALERQTATADILKVIASSPSDAQPVFEAIAASANRLIGGFSTAVYRVIDDIVHLMAFTPTSPEADEALKAGFPMHRREVPTLALVQNGETAQIADAETADPQTQRLGRARGWRSVTFTPLMSQGTFIGFVVCTRRETGVLVDHHVQLLRTFADQAVIAIENTRLFNETQQALERQTATAEILKVIASSPSDTTPVFEAIASSAKRLLGGFSASVFRFVDGSVYLRAFTPTNPDADESFLASFPRPLAGFEPFRLVQHGQPMIPDTEDIANEQIKEIARRRGFRSMLFVPLMNGGIPIGIISVTRVEAGSYAPHHVELLQTFADQAVIAIENARLFNETQEALERQTATAEVLKVIASSPSDVQPVFEAIASSAKRLLGAFSTTVLRFIDDELHLVAYTPTSPEADETLASSFPRKLAEFPTFALVRNGETIQFADTEAEAVPEENRELARLRGFRSVLFTPLMNRGAPVGIISVTRAEPGAFAPHHVQLLQTFADQAVIAIENTRLFNETQEALERQTATAEILKVIAGSPSDTTPVFEAIATSANRLLGGFSTAVFRFVDDAAQLAAFTPTNPAADDILRASFPRPVGDFEAFRLAQHGKPIPITDTEDMAHAQIRDIARLRGFRSMLFVPLMNGSVPIGIISVTRLVTGSFAPHHVQLLQTFADQAVIAIENTRLFNETREALERQTATADILKVIASSPSDVQPVFDAIATSGHRLLGGFSTSVFSIIDDMLHLSAFTPTNPAADALLQASFPRPLAAESWNHRMLNGETVEIPDYETDPIVPEELREMWRKRGFRSLLLVPLVRSGKAIGMVNTTRVQPGRFSSHHVQLLQTFADQAVIAIENTRLFNETKEALERQTATADVLKVIASSPSDVQPTFDAIVHSANRLIGGFSTAVFCYGDGKIHLAAFTPTDAQGDAVLQSSFPVPLEAFPPYHLTLDGAPAELPDTETEPAARDIARARGYRSMLFAPLMNDGEAVGIITVTRVAPGPFGEQHTHLLQMFADQAVIAIKNVGLFNEVQARTEELSEALQQQTATADVLKAISRSAFDLETVLDALLSSACRLCDADIGTIRYREGGEFRLAATFGCKPEWIEHFQSYSTKPDRGSVFGRTIVEGHIVHIPDLLADREFNRPEAQKLMGIRAALGVPLTREGEAFGVISLFRFNVSPFEIKQIELVQTFADQAVIAIENVRLFNETQEALERQTATSDILKVIASSPSDIQPVFDVIVERAVQLCGARMGRVYRYDGNLIHLVGGHGLSVPGRDSAQRPFPRPALDDTIVGRVMLSRSPNILPDLNEDDSVPPLSRQMIEAIGARSQVTMPMLLGGQPIGAITLSWAEPRGYTDQQIVLLRTFADQAVIAIENARLFNEVRQRTDDLQARTVELTESLEQQTATSEVLRVISSSAGDLAPVFDTMLRKAMELCGANFGTLNTFDGERFHTAATYGLPPAYDEYRRRQPLQYGPGTAPALLMQGEPFVEITDLPESETYRQGEPNRRALVDLGGARCLLAVPLLKDGRVTGNVMIFRQENRRFSEKQITLLKQFAAQAVIAIENTRLLNELHHRTDDLSEALTYQTGSANILRVIASSPTDVKPVLQAIVESACELCGAYDALVRLRDGDGLAFGAHHGPLPVSLESVPITENSTAGLAVIGQEPVHVHDLLSAEGDRFPHAQELARAHGERTILSVPLLRENESVGAIIIRRREVNPFTDKQIALLQTFADQAVIAIGNVRLFEEVQAKTHDLSEALRYQTGSANILNVIASSPTDVQPVLKAIVESACDLCDANDAVVLLSEGEHLAFRAHHGPIAINIDKWPVSRDWSSGRAFLDRAPVHVPDVFAEEASDFTGSRQLSERTGSMGVRSVLAVPLLRENESIGAILLRRREMRPFNEKQIALLQTFADQAVIAIGNVRLFEEVQAKTHHLEEALTYQTGSANILRVIASSPTDVKPVLTAIVDSVCEICDANDALVFLKDDDDLVFAAHHGTIPIEMERWPINRKWVTGRAVADKAPQHVHDLRGADGDDFPEGRELARHQGQRTVLSVPLLREGEAIGAISLRRIEVDPFNDKQIALLQTFADQAVIAIGNVRLFEEVQQRTQELSESLQFQTASSEVLKVISSSPDALQPVLDAVVQTSRELCGSDGATIVLFRDRKAHFVAVAGVLPQHFEFLRANPASIDEPGSLFERMVREKRTLHLPNVMDDPEISRHPRTAMGGPRALLVTPLVRDGEPLGAIVLRQSHLKPFTPRQIQAIEVFADQAVIAISNVELFEQVQQRTRELTESLQQQTATSEVLQVISASPGELAPVFEKMLENATRVCGAKFGSMLLAENGSMRPAATYNVPAEFAAARGDRVLTPHPKSTLAKAISTKQVVHVADMRTTEAYLERSPASIEFVELGGARTVAIVPMLRDDEVIGAITVYRNEVQLFSDKQIELLSNFAKQAVIAIENARLLKELRQRTDDLSKSLDDLRTAQDRLVQTEKLASLGQLTAGIAHEIKNPLNFVNNFAALSAELTVELNEVLKPAGIGDKMRAEVNELTGLLKDNLEKVVQHGKRADSIVKNMLLHSREGGGEHRPSDINALIDESLNLAYHGARAEKPDFNVTLERDFDPEAGQVDLFPQEITRVFLNLVSNGFYAVTKRRKEAGASGFEPTLRASTKSLGEAVEIRIRDNGTGIPAEVKEKMFNPFFTTKPAGEGTGLGLSMSHDIIVKQHGGTIDVDTRPGHFTEFRIVLPRTSNFADKSRG